MSYDFRMRNLIFKLKSSITINCLPLSAFVVTSLIIAFLYNQRLSTRIFKNDFYLIWITGSICWSYIFLKSSILLKHLGKIAFIGVAYIVFLCLIHSFPDENSIHVLITIVSCLGIIYYLRTVNNTSSGIVITVILLLSYFIQVLLGYFQAAEHNWESLSIKGQLYNSGFFGNYLASMIPLLLSGVTNKINFSRYLRIGFLIAFFFVSLLIVFAGARAAYIGSTMGCLFVLFSLSRKINRNFKIFFIASAIILFLMIIALYELKPASAKGRLTIYKISLDIIKNHPFTGIGPNRFAAVYNNYQAEYFKEKQASLPTQLLADNTLEAFNSFLQIVVEYGIIGFIIFFVIVYRIIKLSNSRSKNHISKWLHIASVGCIISIFICSLFSNPFHVTPILLIFAYHVSIILPIQKKDDRDIPWQRNLKIVPCIIFLALVFYFITLFHKAETSWYKASEAAKYDSFSEAKINYDNAYSTLKYNGDFLFNYGAEAAVAGNYRLAIILLEDAKKYNSSSNLFLFLGDSYSATRQYTLAEKNYLRAIYTVPSHIYPKYQLIQLYKRWNKPELVKTWIDKTLQYPVKIKSEITDELLEELKEEAKNHVY